MILQIGLEIVLFSSAIVLKYSNGKLVIMYYFCCIMITCIQKLDNLDKSELFSSFSRHDCLNYLDSCPHFGYYIHILLLYFLDSNSIFYNVNRYANHASYKFQVSFIIGNLKPNTFSIHRGRLFSCLGIAHIS